MSIMGIVGGVCFALGWIGCMLFDYLYDKHHK